MRNVWVFTIAFAAALPAGKPLVAIQVPTRADFVGEWVSETKTSNVTNLQSNGRFRTRYLQGLTEIGSVTGTWEVRGGAIVWTYEGANVPPGEDVNPIVERSASRFVLREEDGTLSPAFHRKGVVDPLSPAHLPVAIGTGWILEDDHGGMAIRVGVREQVGAREAYRVDWIDGPDVYQSEYWVLDVAGLHAIGRRVLGRSLPFEAPYLLLKKTLAPNDSWSGRIKTDALDDVLKFSVGVSKAITTPAGTFDATPVTMQGSMLEYRRWYAVGVGLVLEESGLSVAAGGASINSKRLKARIQ